MRAGDCEPRDHRGGGNGVGLRAGIDAGHAGRPHQVVGMRSCLLRLAT